MERSSPVGSFKKSRHPKTYLSMNNTILETNLKPRTQGHLSVSEGQALQQEAQDTSNFCAPAKGQPVSFH